MAVAPWGADGDSVCAIGGPVPGVVVPTSTLCFDPSDETSGAGGVGVWAATAAGGLLLTIMCTAPGSASAFKAALSEVITMLLTGAAGFGFSTASGGFGGSVAVCSATIILGMI